MTTRGSSPRACAQPGCGATLDPTAGPADGWTRFLARDEYYCPEHHDAPVPAAWRRLLARHPRGVYMELRDHEGPWPDEDLRDWLTAVPTASAVWRRMCAEALARIDEADREIRHLDLAHPAWDIAAALSKEPRS